MGRSGRGNSHAGYDRDCRCAGADLGVTMGVTTWSPPVAPPTVTDTNGCYYSADN